jgi:4-carboxymuconolactone decarboxylase
MTQDPDFGTFGRFQETPVADMPEAMRKAYDRTKRLRGLVPGPHRIWLANPRLSETIVPTGAYFQTSSTLTKAEIEIATCLTVGRWCSAYASYEHERIAEIQGGLAVDKVQRMLAGLSVDFANPREAVVYQLAYALIQPRPVSLGLYRRAKGMIGDPGIVDVAVLIGWFTMVSITLAAFDVPANADKTALDQ